MRLIFRADGNAVIGSGHVMRCLSIADAAMARGIPVCFLCADDGFADTIQSRGMQAHILDSDSQQMEAELPALEKLLAQRPDLVKDGPVCVVVDSYFTTEAYFEGLRQVFSEAMDAARAAGASAAEDAVGTADAVGAADATVGAADFRICFIDDMQEFAYPVDGLLCYGIGAEVLQERYEQMYREAGRPCPRLLLGGRYIPLRAEFAGLPQRVVREQAADVLVSTGGADSFHVCLKLAQKLAAAGTEGLVYHLVVGKMNRDAEAICALAADCPNLVVHQNVQKMAQLMQRCDLAVSASGSTLYELCATQTPGITYVLADNQLGGALMFEREGVLQYAGDIRELGEALPEKLVSAAKELAADFEKRKEIAGKQRLLLDGMGAGRVAAAWTDCW